MSRASCRRGVVAGSSRARRGRVSVGSEIPCRWGNRRTCDLDVLQRVVFVGPVRESWLLACSMSFRCAGAAFAQVLFSLALSYNRLVFTWLKTTLLAQFHRHTIGERFHADVAMLREDLRSRCKSIVIRVSGRVVLRCLAWNARGMSREDLRLRCKSIVIRVSGDKVLRCLAWNARGRHLRF